MTEYLDIEVSVCGLARNTFRDTIMKFLYFLLTVISFQYRVTRVSGIKDNSLIFRTVPLRVIFEGHSVRFYGRNIKISQNDSGTKFHVSKKKHGVTHRNRVGRSVQMRSHKIHYRRET